MATIELTSESFNSTITGNEIVLIDFWAGWCGPCRMFAPVYEQAAQLHPDITFAKVDTEAEPSLSASFQIRSIPTLMAVRDGVILFSQPGALPAPALERVIAAVREVDMDAVRAQLDGQEAGAQGSPN